MAKMETWVNGASGSEVKNVIEKNFNTLSEHLSSNILALTTDERMSLSGNYISEGLRVFDKTLEVWFKYSKNSWEECPVDKNSLRYTANIMKYDWKDNIIYIAFSTHKVQNPIVQLYIQEGNGYSPVFGGVIVDDNFNITLTTDLPFAGKVVVK